MRNLVDWKFLLTLAVAVASAAVPLWLWRADLVAHSLHFRLAAQTALQPDEKNALSGLTLSIDGVVLESPYLSVFELMNDGSKSIASTDFESAIELRLEPNAVVARARVTATTPKDLATELVVEKQSVKLKPLLLNPDDTVTIAVITSGKAPQFLPWARIAGVRAVALEDATKSGLSGAKKWVLGGLALLFSYCFAVIYWVVFDGVLKETGVLLRRRFAKIVSLVSMFAVIVPLFAFFLSIGERDLWPVIPWAIGVLLVASGSAKFWNRDSVGRKRMESNDGA